MPPKAKPKGKAKAKGLKGRGKGKDDDKDDEKLMKGLSPLERSLRKVFKKFDTNKSESLELNELAAALEQHVGVNIKAENLQAVLDEYDDDKTGALEFPQFMKMVLRVGVETEEIFEAKRNLTEDEKDEISRFYDVFDEDKSGAIDTREFSEGMKSLGYEMSVSECRALFADVDLDSNGFIDKEEFTLLVTQLMEGCRHLDQGFILLTAEENRTKEKRLRASVEEFSKMMLTAAGEGDLHSVRRISQSHVMGRIPPTVLNAIDDQERTVLSIATQNAHVPFVNFLVLQSDLALDTPDADGLTPLHHAVINDRTQGFQMLRNIARAKADLEAREKRGFTPLILAGATGVVGAVSALLDSGCKLDPVCPSGWSAMDHALRGPMAIGRANSCVLLREWGRPLQPETPTLTPVVEKVESGRSIDSISAVVAATPRTKMLRGLDKRCENFSQSLEKQVAEIQIPQRKKEQGDAACDRAAALVEKLNGDMIRRMQESLCPHLEFAPAAQEVKDDGSPASRFSGFGKDEPPLYVSSGEEPGAEPSPEKRRCSQSAPLMKAKGKKSGQRSKGLKGFKRGSLDEFRKSPLKEVDPVSSAGDD